MYGKEEEKMEEDNKVKLKGKREKGKTRGKEEKKGGK